MKIAGIIGPVVLCAAAAVATAEVPVQTLRDFVTSVHYYGNAGLTFTLAGKAISIDPTGTNFTPHADLVLVTHEHGDHFAPPTIKKIADASTTIYGNWTVVNTLAKSKIVAKEVSAGSKVQFGDVSIDVVPAYNFKEADGNQRPHWFTDGGVGYVLHGDGMTIYVTGDTQRVPEMKGITTDIVFLPLGQTYTMTSVEDAVGAALDVKARLAVPIHWGMYEGTRADADKFATLLTGKVEVVIKMRS